VLDLPGAVVTDSNAGSKYARFSAGPEGLQIVDRQLTFAQSWKQPADQIEEWKRKVAKCAEVLVPDLVEPKFLMGAYVSCQEALSRLNALRVNLVATVNADVFFL
jgi:hypothetical protein